MRLNTLNQSPSPRSRRRRKTVAASRRQYSLFDAVPIAPQADAEHFRRQAQLCQRLLSAMHQPDLVETLGRLHDEYEATAARMESGIRIASQIKVESPPE
jgi:hypothetical protein